MTYECPDVIWRGPFRQVADILEKRSWEVWLGVFSALGAIAHKNLHFTYHIPLHGMAYTLLIADTGSGKTLCTNTCRALLPSWYRIRTNTQSGPGLANVMAEITRDRKGGIEKIEVHPSMLILDEWSSLAKLTLLPYSTLSEDLNKVFQSEKSFDLNRSDKLPGGSLVIRDPVFSICATTTIEALQTVATPTMFNSGFLNRYLILPGSADTWKFHVRGKAVQGVQPIRGLFDELAGRTFGQGEPVWEAYEPKAMDLMDTWGGPFFESIRATKPQTPLSQSAGRLHFYAHLVALLYAWSEGSKKVHVGHVQASMAVIEASYTFLSELTTGAIMEIPKNEQYRIDVERRILEYIKRAHDLYGNELDGKEDYGVPKPRIQNALNKIATSKYIGEQLDALCEARKLKITGTRPKRFSLTTEDEEI